MKKMMLIFFVLLSFTIYAKNTITTNDTDNLSSIMNNVSHSFIYFKNKNVLIDDLLKEAEKHIGKKYKWATRGPKTFDCSGFTYYVFKQFGYDISAGSRVQWGKGILIENRQDARKGDLIFFTSRKSGKRVGHVGIVHNVCDNDIYFIHASLSNVKISKLEGYYEKRFVGIRRIII